MFEIGSSLREARLRHGLDFPEVEQATKIRGKYLRALEDEEFDVLPAQTYVKGFLRAYADHLGLDGQLYVDEFNSRYVTGDDEPVLRAHHRVSQQRRRTVESRAVVLTLLGIAAVAALVIVAWKSGGTPQQNLPGTLRPATVTTAGKATHAKRTRPPLARLVLRAAHGGSLLEVRRGGPKGKRFAPRALVQGARIGWRARTLWLKVSAPENLVAVLNGRTVRLAGAGPTVYVVNARRVRRVPTG